jgi:hypothetical protein
MTVATTPDGRSRIAWARRTEDLELERHARAARSLREVPTPLDRRPWPILVDLTRPPVPRRWSARRAATRVGLAVAVASAVAWYVALLAGAHRVPLEAWAAGTCAWVAAVEAAMLRRGG